MLSADSRDEAIALETLDAFSLGPEALRWYRSEMDRYRTLYYERGDRTAPLQALTLLTAMSSNDVGAPILLPGDWWPDWLLDAVTHELLRPFDEHRRKGAKALAEACALERAKLKREIAAIRAEHPLFSQRAAVALYLERQAGLDGTRADLKAIDAVTRRLRSRRRRS